MSDQIHLLVFPLLQIMLNLVAVGGLIHILFRSRSWTGPVLSAAISELERKHEYLEHRYSSAEQRISTISNLSDSNYAAIMKKLTDMNDRLELLSALQQQVRLMDDRLFKVEQDQETMFTLLNSLSCAEKKWHEAERPGHCPLHNIQCPLNGKKDA